MKFQIILITLIGIYLAMGLMLYLFQERLIFFGVPLSPEHQYEFDRPFEEHTLQTPNKGSINVLEFKADSARGMIVYFHGNAGNLARWGFVTEFYVDQGYDVAIMDYRGYGKSTGELSQKNLLVDAEAVYDYFRERAPDLPIVLYGRSLGTGIASYLASKQPPDKLILETPYYSFTSLAQHHMPLFPAGLALRYRYPTYKYLREANYPVYIFHGTADEVVPYEQGKRLYESLAGKNVQLITISGGGHNDLIDYQAFREAMHQALAD